MLNFPYPCFIFLPKTQIHKPKRRAKSCFQNHPKCLVSIPRRLLRSCTTSVPAETNYLIYQKKFISTFYISLFLCSHQVFIGYKQNSILNLLHILSFIHITQNFKQSCFVTRTFSIGAFRDSKKSQFDGYRTHYA